MGIRKADLSEFIDKKIRTRKAEIEEPARKLIKEAVSPLVMEAYKHWAQAEREAVRLLESIDKIRADSPQEDDWHLRETAQKITRNISGKRNVEVVRESTGIFYNLFCGGTDSCPEFLREIQNKLKEDLAPEIEKFKKVNRLGTELLTLINSCRNGDAAYKKLKELEVDLTGFSITNPNLPAIIKLSEDVCVINGNCG